MAEEEAAAVKVAEEAAAAIQAEEAAVTNPVKETVDAKAIEDATVAIDASSTQATEGKVPEVTEEDVPEVSEEQVADEARAQQESQVLQEQILPQNQAEIQQLRSENQCELMPEICKLETELTVVTKQLGKKEKSLLTPETNMDALSGRVQNLKEIEMKLLADSQEFNKVATASADIGEKDLSQSTAELAMIEQNETVGTGGGSGHSTGNHLSLS